MEVPKLRFKEFSGGWQASTVGCIASSVSAGATPSTTKREYWGGDIRWMNSGELNLKRVYEVVNRITEAGLKNSSTKILPVESVLIGLAGQGKTRGTVAINYVPLCTNQSIAAIQPNPEYFVPEFLYQNLDNRYLELRGMSTGDGGRGGLNLQIIKSVPISLPGIPEQKKIAKFLSSVDQKIAHLTKKHELLIQYKKGVMQKIFKQEIRFKNKDGKDFPGWEQVRVGSLGKFIGGGTPSTKNPDLWSGDIPWISSSDISEGSISEIRITRYISLTAIQESAAKLVPKNSILIVSRVGVGKIAIASEDMCTSQDFTNLVLSSANAVFVAYLLKFHSAKLLEFNQGTSIKGFVKADLESLFIPLPHIDEQGKIAAFLWSMDEAVKNIKSKLEFTKQYKQGLLQQMFI